MNADESFHGKLDKYQLKSAQVYSKYFAHSFGYGVHSFEKKKKIKQNRSVFVSRGEKLRALNDLSQVLHRTYTRTNCKPNRVRSHDEHGERWESWCAFFSFVRQ